MNEINIRYSKDALKFLSKLDKKSVRRIRDAITGLTYHPPVGDIKTMQGYNDGRKRLRVGSWRILYRHENEETLEIIFVIDIGNRGDIYINEEVSFMSSITMEAARLMDALPEADKEFAYEFIKKLVLAWDPDFTKVTPEEAKQIEAAENSGYVDETEIDWDSIGTDA